jgi:succinate-semialdehyde dehydrogenase/glutarate-semialdehyde dehydrogenase
MKTWQEFLREANYIDGQWVAARSGETVALTNPFTGEQLGTVPYSGAGEVRQAIEAASRRFESWSKTTAQERSKLIRALADAALANRDALAELLTREQGKPLAEARGEITIAAGYLHWFAEEATRVYGDIIPSPWPGRKLLVTKEPVGVVGAITPWNFPSSMLARKFGPALAAGCTIVAKPAPQTPYSALAWAVLAEEVGIPAGVINIVTGDAQGIGGELTSSPLVSKITFTGSTAVGKLLMKQASDTVKKVSLELGGNAPFLIFDDADIDRAVEGAIAAKFRNAGQTCVCTNRFYVQSGVYDRFVEKFSAAVAALKVGSPLEAGVVQGPLVDDRAVQKVEEMVADARSNGGRVTVGGHRHELGHSYFEPTVIVDANHSMRMSKEEIFGPVAAIYAFDTEAEAIRAANDTPFGLAAYFYSQGLGRVMRVSEGLKYGIVAINEGIVTTEFAPFGGVKESGIGSEGSKYGIQDYLNLKYICLGGLSDAPAAAGAAR